MVSPRSLLMLLIYILTLHLIAIFFFTSGFLLTRTELPNASTCSDPSTAPCRNSTETKCWSSPSVKRAVILIIDALRFDFVARSTHPQQWMNKLPVLQRLANDSHSGARIFKYIADPPTTTLQRLKGLTTGGLPTFIDVGHSFGAPAIVEDNLIVQLVRNGKRVVAMGDDTWVSLFPHHFSEAYPFPSFNVKDLHTVDNGVISHIFPALERDNWDVLIGHFLGVDHVGHIFSVESPLMVEKLEQYNSVIERVVSTLEKESGPGGFHENTLLIVMGDHGQTLTGDHGGGTPEEVETALFAIKMNSGKENLRFSADLRSFPCSGVLEDSCISTLPQLDFAATLAMLLGVPIPFGSLGRVNPELFALSGPLSTNGLDWLKQYQDVLCTNSWQVKRYLETYASAGLGGIPAVDLQQLDALYEECSSSSGDDMWSAREQISKYTAFLSQAASLARSRWTQFGNVRMAAGLALLILSIPVHVVAIRGVVSLRATGDQTELPSIFPGKHLATSSVLVTSIPTAVLYVISSRTGILAQVVEHIGYVVLGAMAFTSAFSYLFFAGSLRQKGRLLASFCSDSRTVAAGVFVLLHAISLLSNSFIMEEGHVANFFLGTLGILYVRYALQSRAKIFQAIVFLVLNRILSGMGLQNIVKDTLEVGQEDSHQRIDLLNRVMDTSTYAVPVLVLAWLATRYFRKSYQQGKKSSLVPMVCVPLVYGAVLLHWLTMDMIDFQLLVVVGAFKEFLRLQLPRLVYFGTLLGTGHIVVGAFKPNSRGEDFTGRVVGLLCYWGASILLLLGRKGPSIGLIALLEVWCILQLQEISPRANARFSVLAVDWNLLAVLLFFCTNHRCTFDGLRYPAAFIGFDDFNLFRQGALLLIDTYGVSHILPFIGLPLLVISRDNSEKKGSRLVLDIALGYLSFGLVRSITTTFSTICVALQRRHLMVWGLFAPKYVFDAIGLLLSDILFIVLSALYFRLVE